MVSTSDFYACPVNANNVKYLPDLIDGQAQHHHSNFTGNTSKLRRDFIAAAKPTANIKLIYHKQMGTKPIGYIAYNETVSEKGTGLYLEDIFIADNVRHQIRGAGSYGFYELINAALKDNMDFIQWAVATNNEPATFYFYERKIGARPLDKMLYDLDDVLINGTTALPELINPDISVSLASKSDLRSIRASIESYNKGSRTPLKHDTDKLIQNIETAITHHNADVYLCKDKNKGLVGFTFCNSNYSTFRTITGLKAEPMIRLTDDAGLYQQALYATAEEFRNDAHASGRTGHIVWGVESADALAHRFMTSQNADVLQMEGHNIASTLVMYGINNQNISASKRDSLIPKNP